MVTVNLIISDAYHAAFLEQARLEGVSLGAWLRIAAQQRLERQQAGRRFRTREDLRAFFSACDAAEGAGAEPDWAQHKETMDQSRGTGVVHF